MKLRDVQLEGAFSFVRCSELVLHFLHSLLLPLQFLLQQLCGFLCSTVSMTGSGCSGLLVLLYITPFLQGNDLGIFRRDLRLQLVDVLHQRRD